MKKRLPPDMRLPLFLLAMSKKPGYPARNSHCLRKRYASAFACIPIGKEDA